MAESLVLIGGGGHCRSCIEVIESAGLSIGGVIDRENGGTVLLGYPWLGDDNAIDDFVQTHSFLITVGQIRSAAVRKKLFEKLCGLHASVATVIASTALVSKYATVGKGTIIMHQAFVNAGSVIGENCIINSKALIEHDCSVGNHTHISTAAIVNGGCSIGKGVFVGSSSVIAQGITIADDVIIGAGSVVIRSIAEGGVYAGNPARRIQK